MKKWLLCAALAFAGCRTIVGIDDLQYRPGPPGGPDGGDAGPTDPRINTCTGAADCRICCKERFKFGKTFEEGEGKRCVCSQDMCEGPTECGADLCSPTSGVIDTTGSGSCIRCIDDRLAEKAKPCVEQACNGNQDCLLGLTCLSACDDGP